MRRLILLLCTLVTACTSTPIPYYVVGGTPEEQEHVHEAAQTWNASVGVDVLVPDPDGYPVHLDDICRDARYRDTPGVATRNRDAPFEADGEPRRAIWLCVSTDPNTVAAPDIYLGAVHEFGHWLGLDDTSALDTVMGPYLWDMSGPTDKDAEQVRARL